MSEILEFTCDNCLHDIDNHTHSGCLVERCKCKVRPSGIVNEVFRVLLMERADIHLDISTDEDMPPPSSTAIALIFDKEEAIKWGLLKYVNPRDIPEGLQAEEV